MLAFPFKGGIKVKRLKVLLPSLILILCFCAVGSVVWADKHPELSDQEKWTACATCHIKATPDIYKEWFGSVHGIGNVKCYQCHGTYEDFHVTPKETSCASCHSAQFAKKPKGKTCWDCHPAHHFFIHK